MNDSGSLPLIFNDATLCPFSQAKQQRALFALLCLRGRIDSHLPASEGLSRL